MSKIGRLVRTYEPDRESDFLNNKPWHTKGVVTDDIWQKVRYQIRSQLTVNICAKAKERFHE